MLFAPGRKASGYGMKLDGPPPDAEHRIVYVVKPTAVSHQ